MVRKAFNVVDEQRQSTRFPKEPDAEFAAIWKDGEEPLMVGVHNESLGGLAIVVDDGSAYPIGREIDIVYRGSFLRGVVRHVQEQSAHRFLVGLECSRLV